MLGFFFWADTSSWLVLSAAAQMLTAAQGDTWCHETEQAGGKKRVGWPFSVTALKPAVLNRSWNWTVREISPRTQTCCGMRKSSLLVFKWSGRLHISSAGLGPVLSTQSCILYLLQSSCASSKYEILSLECWISMSNDMNWAAVCRIWLCSPGKQRMG